ncbi:MAG: peptidoglycan-binding domain-containing protein [Hyphomicrobiales bacterium]
MVLHIHRMQMVGARTIGIVLVAAMLVAAMLGAGFVAAPVHAQEQVQGQDENQDQNQDEAPDPQALYEQAMQAEWTGDYAQARALHTQAAELGFARSHYQLGFLLLDGLGGERDVDAARSHLRTAADDGITLALVPFMYSYDDQDDPQLNPDAAIAGHALLELALRDLGMAGDTIQFWSPPMRRQVQVYLQEAGYYRGAIDGLIGQGSLNALRAFARQRAPLPELPGQGFTSLVLTVQGVTADERPLFAWQDVDNLVDARSAFAGARVEATQEGHWRIGVDDVALIDWPRVEENETLMFQLPGKPQRTDFQFGMDLDAVAEDDLGQCALRASEEDPMPRYTRRCETRIAGVHLVFQAANGPFDDVETALTGPAAPYGERLTAIELSPPVALRLAESQSE